MVFVEEERRLKKEKKRRFKGGLDEIKIRMKKRGRERKE